MEARSGPSNPSGLATRRSCRTMVAIRPGCTSNRPMETGRPRAAEARDSSEGTEPVPVPQRDRQRRRRGDEQSPATDPASDPRARRGGADGGGGRTRKRDGGGRLRGGGHGGAAPMGTIPLAAPAPGRCAVPRGPKRHGNATARCESRVPCPRGGVMTQTPGTEQCRRSNMGRKHHAPQSHSATARSRAIRTLWMTLRTGLALRARRSAAPLKPGTKTPEFLAMNANARVPVIEDDGFSAVRRADGDQPLPRQEACQHALPRRPAQRGAGMAMEPVGDGPPRPCRIVNYANAATGS